MHSLTGVYLKLILYNSIQFGQKVIVTKNEGTY